MSWIAPVTYGTSLVAGVIVPLVISVLGGAILGVIEERSSSISLFFLAIAERLHPEPERNEFLDEALGNLSRIEQRPLRTIGHAARAGVLLDRDRSSVAKGTGSRSSRRIYRVDDGASRG